MTWVSVWIHVQLQRCSCTQIQSTSQRLECWPQDHRGELEYLWRLVSVLEFVPRVKTPVGRILSDNGTQILSTTPSNFNTYFWLDLVQNEETRVDGGSVPVYQDRSCGLVVLDVVTDWKCDHTEHYFKQWLSSWYIGTGSDGHNQKETKGPHRSHYQRTLYGHCGSCTW